MNTHTITYDDIIPFLSERGQYELELAKQRAVIDRLTKHIEELESGTDATANDT